MAPLENEHDQASGDEALEEPETQARTRRRNKRMKMGEDSGLTDAQRNKLRKDQRELFQKLQDGPGEDDEEEDFVPKVRKKNNELFENVRYTREAVLDADNVNSIAAKFVQKADSMISTPRYDAMKFVTKLKSKLTVHPSGGGSYFDWQVLGYESGVCFNSIPHRVSFLIGPLANVKIPEKRKVRVARQKKVVEEEELEEESPEQLKKDKKNVDQLSAQERNLKTARNVLSRRTEEAKKENKAKYNEIKSSQPQDEKLAKEQLRKHGNEIDLVPFLVNPKSFTQTVENIFNFSFLIKKGEAKIKMRQGNSLGNAEGGDSNPLDLPQGGCFIGPGEEEMDGIIPKQCVLSFSMKDWRALSEAYELEKCDLPHRKGTKQKATNFSQPSDDDGEDEMEVEH